MKGETKPHLMRIGGRWYCIFVIRGARGIYGTHAAGDTWQQAWQSFTRKYQWESLTEEVG